MNFIKRWVERRNEKREELEKLESQKIESRIKSAEDKCRDFRQSMFALECPFTESFCNSCCVHFMGGNTYKLPRLDGGVFVGHTLPRCLLWNK